MIKVSRKTSKDWEEIFDELGRLWNASEYLGYDDPVYTDEFPEFVNTILTGFTAKCNEDDEIEIYNEEELSLILLRLRKKFPTDVEFFTDLHNRLTASWARH